MTDELPPGWALVTVGDIAHFVRGVTYSKEHARDSAATGFVPVLRATNIGDGLDYNDMVFVPDRFVSDEQIVKDGDVVLAMSSGSKSVVGKAAIAKSPPRCGFGAFCGVIRPSDAIDHSLLGYYFQTKAYRNAISDVSKGSNINNLKAEHVLCRPLPIPPKTEQARIVSKIDELFSRIDEGGRALERVQKLVERYRQSVLKAAVTGELTRDWREKNGDKLESGEALLARILKARREAWEKAELDKMKAKGITPANDKWKQKYEEPTIADATGLPELPGGWAWASAEALCGSVHSGTTPERHLLQATPSSGVPFIKVYNLTFDGALDFSIDPTYVDAEYHGKHMGRSRSLPGDVLTNIVGPPLGKVSVVPHTFPEWNINQAVVGFRPLSGFRNDFLSVYLQSEIAKSWLRSTTKTTTSQVNLAVTTCRRMPVPVPSEPEQAQIAETVLRALSYADDMMTSARRCSCRATALRQSTLKAAFAGRLLPQSPTDEPAYALVERIAAERSEAPAKPKRGRKPKTPESA